MTLDGILNVVLAFGVPGLMALIGGILAARTLPAKDGKRNTEVWFWTASFVFLWLLSIVLAIVQQVRATSTEMAQVQIAHEKELRDTGTMQFMAGRLDSIDKVLTSNSFGSDSNAVVSVLRNMSASTHPQRSDLPIIQSWSNKRLRDQVISFANDMRKAVSDYGSEEEQRTTPSVITQKRP